MRKVIVSEFITLDGALIPAAWSSGKPTPMGNAG
jgi:hypothetical protein